MLEEIDIEILKFINENKELHINEILKKFPENKFSTSFRIQRLNEPDFKTLEFGIRVPVENSSYILSATECFTNSLGETDYKKLDIYHLTDLGTTFIQDHSRKVKRQKKDFFKQFLFEVMRSFFFPLIVAFLTTLLTLWLKKYLI